MTAAKTLASCIRQAILSRFRALTLCVAEELEHVVGRGVLRDVVPRLGVDLRGLIDDRERHGRGGGDQRFVLGDVHREVGEFAGGREVKVVFERLRVVGLEAQVDGLRGLAVEHGNRPLGNLHQHVELLAGRGGVGDHHLAAVDRVDQEFVGDELVDRLAVLDALPVAVPEEILADEHLGRAVGGRGGLDLLVEDDHRPARREVHLRPVELRLVLGRLERQIEHGQGHQHFGEVARRGGQIPRQERRRRVVLRVILPEGVDGDQGGVLLIDGQVVIVVLGPFPGLVELAVELPELFAFARVRVEELDLLVGVPAVPSSVGLVG